jgi:hypothetical protein
MLSKKTMLSKMADQAQVDRRRSQLPAYCMHLRKEAAMRSLSGDFESRIVAIENELSNVIADEIVVTMHNTCKAIEDDIFRTPSRSGLPIVQVEPSGPWGMAVMFAGERITGSAAEIADKIAAKVERKN